MLYFNKRGGGSTPITEEEFNADTGHKVLVNFEMHLIDAPVFDDVAYNTAKRQAQAAEYLEFTDFKQGAGSLTGEQQRLRAKARLTLDNTFVEPKSDLFDVD